MSTEIRAITGMRRQDPHYKSFQIVFEQAGTQEILIKPGSVGDSIQPQYALIDATNMSGPTILTAGDVNYVIPAGSTVGYPIIVANSVNLRFSTVGTGSINLILSDTSIAPFNAGLSQPVSLSGALPAGANNIGNIGIVPTTGALNDASGTITTASTSQQVLAAGDATTFLQFQNLSADPMYINFGADATDTAGSIELSSGQLITYSDTFIPNQSLSVFSATAGAAFTCKYV